QETRLERPGADVWARPGHSPERDRADECERAPARDAGERRGFRAAGARRPDASAGQKPRALLPARTGGRSTGPRLGARLRLAARPAPARKPSNARSAGDGGKPLSQEANTDQAAATDPMSHKKSPRCNANGSGSAFQLNGEYLSRDELDVVIRTA